VEVSGELHAPTALPPEVERNIRWTWGCVDSGVGLDFL
jgi:hypothetical protein